MAAPQKTQTQQSSPIPHLWQIAAAGEIEQLEEILNRGADVNTSNPSGLTPLMVAAYHGRIEMVRALIERGAEVNAVDDEGLTAAMLADDAGHDEIVRVLVGRAVKRKRTLPAPETSQLQSAADETANAGGDTAEPTSRPPAVRTLLEPPDIWDMVHETRTEFKPGSAFFGRLTFRNSLIAAAILLTVSAGVALCFVGLRRLSSDGTAMAPAPAESNNPKPSAVAGRPNKNRSPDKRAIIKTAEAVTAISSLFDPRKLVAGAAGLREPTAVPSRLQPPTTSSARGDVVLFHADDKKKTQKSNFHTGNNGTLAALENGDRGQLTVTKADNDKRANSAAARKETGKVPTPESISPPKPNPAPKGKVIQWPE
jgi:hypothetical protein